MNGENTEKKKNSSISGLFRRGSSLSLKTITEPPRRASTLSDSEMEESNNQNSVENNGMNLAHIQQLAAEVSTTPSEHEVKEDDEEEEEEEEETEAEANRQQEEEQKKQQEKQKEQQEKKKQAKVKLEQISGELLNTLYPHLAAFKANLKKAIINDKHHGKVDEIHDEILNQLSPLVKEASQEKLAKFKTWFNTMVEGHKDTFPEESWLRHGAIKNIFMKLLSVIVKLVTLALRPFIKDLSQSIDAFFKPADSKGTKALKDAGGVLNSAVENTLYKEKLEEMETHRAAFSAA